MLKTKSNSLPLTLLLLAGACICLGLLCLYFCTGAYGFDLFAWYFTQPLVLVLNILPLLALALVLLALTNRAWLTFFVEAAVCLIFSWTQHWKLLARGDPIYAEDLVLIGEATQMAGSYIRITWQVILSGLIVLVLTAMLFFLARGRIRKRLPRLALAVLVPVLSVSVFTHYYDRNLSYYAMTVWPELNAWFETNNYISRGGIYSFLRTIPDALPTPPEGYRKAEAEAILSAYPSDEIPADKQVSVIVTQLEAFADLSVLTDRITGPDPYAEYHAILEESFHGALLPNVFAGGTIDTERCVLTGFSALENFRRPSWSYARYFAGQGYAVEGAHAGYEAFYNRRNVNDRLGISDYRFIEGYYDTFMEGVPYDDVFLPDVTENVLAALEDGPVFSFNVTYQNHGPYSADYAWFPEAYVPQENIPDSDWFIVNNYLWGVQKTGRRMQEMTEQFRAIDEPVILVFFGDHKPWLGEQSVTYDALGIDIRSGTTESFYNYYATDYLIWANDAAKAVLGTDFTGTGPDISPCFLMNVLFDLCGWEGPGYRKLTDEVMAQLPMLHTTGRYLTGSTLTDTLTPQQQELKNRMTLVQYYLAQDAGGMHP